MKISEKIQQTKEARKVKAQAKTDFNFKVSVATKTAKSLVEEMNSITSLVDYYDKNLRTGTEYLLEQPINMVISKISETLTKFETDYKSFFEQHKNFENSIASKRSTRKEREALKMLNGIKSKIDHEFVYLSRKFEITCISSKKAPLMQKFNNIIDTYDLLKRNEDIATV